MKPVAVAVIGAGPMGRLHARIAARTAALASELRLVAIVDRHAARAATLARELGVASCDEPGRLGALGIEAVVVAVPTAAHVETGLAVLDQGLDLLVEKPLAIDARDATRLIERADAAARILQVGHVEWYNLLWRRALDRAGRPRRISVVRLQPRSERGLDVDVVQDLMLHDLDWVIRAVGEEVEDFTARGERGPSGALDEAEVRLRFRSGCEAGIRASRVHASRERWLEVEGDRGSVATSLLAGHAERAGGRDDELDPLALQWRAFARAVRSRKPPENDGRVGLAALAWVERVRERIRTDRAGGSGGHDPRVGT